MGRPNLGKVKLTLTVRKDVLDAVREYIPNLSAFVELKFLEFLSYVQHPIAADLKWGRRDLNSGHRLPKPRGSPGYPTAPCSV